MVALAAAAAGFYFYSHQRMPLAGSAAQATARLARLSLPDPAGTPQSLTQWRGKVLVLNFWATWCAPCREEIPGLVRLQRRFASNGLQIIGIAIDSSSKVRDFAREFEINYPLMVGEIELIDLTRQLGNRASGLPFTIILDRSGKITNTHLGRVSEEELTRWLRPLFN
ncbi:MAG: TlpA disulfide reductase family protein [Burkholderiales bacterium]